MQRVRDAMTAARPVCDGTTTPGTNSQVLLREPRGTRGGAGANTESGVTLVSPGAGIGCGQKGVHRPYRGRLRASGRSGV